MRKAIYQTVHIYHGHVASVMYKYVMIVVIAASLLPLTLKQKPAWCVGLEAVCLVVFAVDYLLRWMTADFKFQDHSVRSFVRYPFRLISVIDLLSIGALVSSLTGLFSEMAPMLMVFRVVRVLRYSRNVRTIFDILRRSKKPLMAVGGLAVGYIIISAIIVFNVEPQSFETFFEAVYWSTVSLTTVGYGDIYPVTMLGRIVAMLSSFFGIAVVALPAGIVTAEYIGTLKLSDGQ